MAEMRVKQELVVLTRYDSKFGFEFLQLLAHEGVAPGLVIIQTTTLVQRLRMAKFLAKKIGWMDALRYNLKFLLPLLKRGISFGLIAKLPDFSVFEKTCLFFCKDINAESVVAKLQHPSYQKIILAQSGIIRDGILSLSGKWIVNAHPGSLPAYRGVDVVKWALWNKHPIMATLHLVRKGVDTGEILKVEQISVNDHDAITDIERKVNHLCIRLLVEAALHGPEHFPNPVQQDLTEGQQYYLMPFSMLKQLNDTWDKYRTCHEKIY